MAFNHSISGQVLEWSASLDHFIHKRKYLFWMKWSRLVKTFENETRNWMVKA